MICKNVVRVTEQLHGRFVLVGVVLEPACPEPHEPHATGRAVGALLTSQRLQPRTCLTVMSGEHPPPPAERAGDPPSDLDVGVRPPGRRRPRERGPHVRSLRTHVRGPSKLFAALQPALRDLGEPGEVLRVPTSPLLGRSAGFQQALGVLTHRLEHPVPRHFPARRHRRLNQGALDESQHNVDRVVITASSVHIAAASSSVQPPANTDSLGRTSCSSAANSSKLQFSVACKLD